ncbi:interleukin-23 subunit alpha-like [Leucoraja erinacea]|uniref:interleukin-23 subunit alpha-like n=1 Tax=Leucoraja erinaceus TaxID=7782 RepID=UPI002454DADF|nr:interleukin-23 subunit alpha-like [Leucoraja erinacea]
MKVAYKAGTVVPCIGLCSTIRCGLVLGCDFSEGMMQRCFGIVALVWLLSVAGIVASETAQQPSWISCRILSRNLTSKVSNYTHKPEGCSENLQLNGSDNIPRIEISDNCDPNTLRTVPETCLKKIKEGLLYYHNQFNQLGKVRASKHSDIRTFADNLSKISLDLLKSIKISDDSTDATDYKVTDNSAADELQINDWILDCTMFVTLRRFQSFSSLVARVFGHPSGNPSNHHST